MAPRRASETELVAVTNQYPRELLDALNELVTISHVPKAHHLREALRHYLEAHGRRPRPLWEFCGERVPVIISSPQKTKSASLPEMYALIELGDHLYSSQLDVYLNSDSTWKRELVLAESFIVLGGPRQNRVAVELLRHWDRLMPFQLKDKRQAGQVTYAISNRDTGETWVPDTARGERVMNDFSDFGLVVKARSPYGPGTCLLLAGCHAFGTHAAVRALSDPRSVAVISRLLPSTETHFAAVVQVRVRNFCPEPPAVVDLIAMAS
jgi:hypothetical protein